mmetsp:Transcript_24053/g.74750  ORF Transcript_24053/g.74750 Transcript_24053/m.74750 type:complete len:793 (+) Transcript_24053:3818-6196(+)
MYALLNIFCFWPLVAASTAVSLSEAFFVRSINFCSAAFTTGTAAAMFDSTELVDALIVFWVVTKAVPSSSRVSSASSSPSSHWIGFANSSTFSTSASASLIFSSSSTAITLPWISLSPVPAAFTCLARSCWQAFRRACSFAMAAAASGPLASFCLAKISFFASKQAVDASPSTSFVFSAASLIASAEILSKLSHKKGFAASATTSTFFSAATIPSTTSASRDDIFRSTVSFLKLMSFCPAASARFSSSVNASVVLLMRSTDKRFVSAILVRMKTFAWFTMASDLAAATSESLMAFVDSSCGRISKPLRKGISASWHLARDCSACSTFSVAMTSISSVALPSLCLFSTRAMASSFLRMPMARSLMRPISSLMGPAAVRCFASRTRSSFIRSFCRGAIISSAAVTSSSDMAPFSDMVVTMLAFSTSNSKVSIFAEVSVSANLASTRALKSLRKVLYGFSLVWPSVSFCCNTEHSESALFRVSGAYSLAAWSFKLICFLASEIFSCASVDAASISPMAVLKGSPSAGGSVKVGDASSITPVTADSELDTSSLTTGRVSSNSLEFSSSCFFCASFTSAAFMAAWIFENCALTLFSSAVMLPWATRTLGDSLVISVTELTPAAPHFLAWAMSCVMDVWSSMSNFCWFCRVSITSLTVASSGSFANAALTFANASVAPVSAAATESVAFFTRSGRSLGSMGAAGAAAAAAAPPPPGLGTVTPEPAWTVGLIAVAAAAVPPKGSQKRMPGSALAASHGIFQPMRGGLSPWELARAQTWEPPRWSPNHQPPKSAPSRVSQ